MQTGLRRKVSRRLPSCFWCLHKVGPPWYNQNQQNTTLIGRWQLYTRDVKGAPFLGCRHRWCAGPRSIKRFVLHCIVLMVHKSDTKAGQAWKELYCLYTFPFRGSTLKCSSYFFKKIAFESNFTTNKKFKNLKDCVARFITWCMVVQTHCDKYLSGNALVCIGP